MRLDLRFGQTLLSDQSRTNDCCKSHSPGEKGIITCTWSINITLHLTRTTR